MSEGHLPTFVLIGAMKSGTTSLHRYLDVHPDICMSIPKEPDFFTADSNRDLETYKQCFRGEAKEYGESSTNYTKYPTFRGVPERMVRFLPDAKLLYLVRDPIERAVSHYVHGDLHGRESDSIEDAFLPPEESHYVQTSRYYLQLSRYLEFYPLEQVLIVESEELRSDRSHVMETIFHFLGVAGEIDEANFEEEHHATSKKVDPGVSTFFHRTKVGRALKSAGLAVLPQGLIDRGVRTLRMEVDRPTLGAATRERVRAYLEEDVEKLRKLTEKSFNRWSV